VTVRLKTDEYMYRSLRTDPPKTHNGRVIWDERTESGTTLQIAPQLMQNGSVHNKSGCPGPNARGHPEAPRFTSGPRDLGSGGIRASPDRLAGRSYFSVFT
jgi:hypothetical protein